MIKSVLRNIVKFRWQLVEISDLDILSIKLKYVSQNTL